VFNLIPGDYLGPARLGPVHVRGTKPVIFHPLLLGPLLLLAGFAAWAEAVSIGRHLASSMQPAAAILVAFAVSQALVLAISSTSDRYYLPVAAPLVILLAGRIGRLGSRAAGLRAATALAIFVGCLYPSRGAGLPGMAGGAFGSSTTGILGCAALQGGRWIRGQWALLGIAALRLHRLTSCSRSRNPNPPSLVIPPGAIAMHEDSGHG